MSRLRVAVIQGGRSGEHEISIRSAQAVIAHLDPQRFEPVLFHIRKDGAWQPGPILPEPGANPNIDVVFPVLHGTFGEDGTLQGLLEMAGLPYVGAGVFSSAASMDKEHFKRLCVERGLPIVPYQVHPSDNLDPDRVLAQFELPVFVKPANLGSSVGISKCKTREELAAGMRDAARYDLKVIVEQAITGHELECAVVGNSDPVASTPCEILPSRDFYDYDDKYCLDTARTIIPPNLPAGTIARVQRLSIECYKALDCAGMARVDFLVQAPTGEVYLNEINTIPGFTSISMFPKMMEHSGLSFRDLVSRLIDLALERHLRRQALRYER
ncbi:MAG: D-alanine--D-alanine ligase [Candidatus Solibacter usitatus]|nr:D-alanine--D-alanine ligase [Candidatus Solibacter usitatus]